MNSNNPHAHFASVAKQVHDRCHATAVCLLSLSLMVAGCGSLTGPSAQAVEASISSTNGIDALELDDWVAAEAEFTIAIDANELTGDQYEEAMLGRARARLQTENLDGAEEDLNMLEEGAAAMDQVLALRAELYLKRGDAAAAKETFQLARKINRNVAAPTGL